MSESWVSISRVKENYIGSQEFESVDNSDKNLQVLQVKEINPPKNPFIKYLSSLKPDLTFYYSNISPTSRREETYYEKFKNIG